VSAPRVRRGPQREWDPERTPGQCAWREAPGTWEALATPGLRTQVGRTETMSRKADGRQGVGSAHSTQRR
jgi:hypothetical protein